jgi:hypothetical protein
MEEWQRYLVFEEAIAGSPSNFRSVSVSLQALQSQNQAALVLQNALRPRVFPLALTYMEVGYLDRWPIGTCAEFPRNVRTLS